MKNKGFTLIELLAVIVILAIIALIATPIILGIINDARESAKKRSAEANKELFREFGHEIEASWSNEFIEISPYGCSKSNGLKFIENYLKINHSDIYVVGDSGNDISMFKEYQEQSFCMSHAPLSVSKYAKHTIKRFENIETYLYQDIERK